MTEIKDFIDLSLAKAIKKIKINPLYIENFQKMALIVDEAYKQNKKYDEISDILNRYGYVTKTGLEFNKHSSSKFATKCLGLPERHPRRSKIEILKKQPETIQTTLPIVNIQDSINTDLNYVNPENKTHNFNENIPTSSIDYETGETKITDNFKPVNLSIGTEQYNKGYKTVSNFFDDLEPERFISHKPIFNNSKSIDENLKINKAKIELKEIEKNSLNNENYFISPDYIEYLKSVCNGTNKTIDINENEIKFLNYTTVTFTNLDFYNSQLTVIQDNQTKNKYFIPKQVSNALSINWSGQLQRIKRDEDMSEYLKKVSFKSQPNIILPIEKLSIFLYGIKADLCHDLNIGLALKQFKKEVEEVLYNNFINKTEIDKPKSTLEALHIALGQMVELESKTNKAFDMANQANESIKLLETKIKNINDNTEYIKNELDKPLKIVDPNLAIIRSREALNQYIRLYCHLSIKLDATKDDKEQKYIETWRTLRSSSKYLTLNDNKRHNFDAIAIKRNIVNVNNGVNVKEVKWLDIVEEIGCMDNILALAQSLFPLNKEQD